MCVLGAYLVLQSGFFEHSLALRDVFRDLFRQRGQLGSHTDLQRRTEGSGPVPIGTRQKSMVHMSNGFKTRRNNSQPATVYNSSGEEDMIARLHN
jgi:hypothetical protein